MTDGHFQRHYGKEQLIEAIAAALRRLGKDPAQLNPADLAGVDEFHVRGREASKELAAKLLPEADAPVLDIGCGLGGPSRLLAAGYGCRVTGIDLTEDYCRAASTLSEWVGLTDRVAYACADALALPFADAGFAHVWTQHVAMNIADKPRLYHEVFRVLRPHGRFALYDVLQGPAGEALLPVPWARETTMNYLATPEALRRLLSDAGFEIVHWQDSTALGRRWFAEASRRIGEKGLPPLGVGLLLGPAFAQMAANMSRNLDEGRIVLIEAVCRRPS